MRRATRVLRPMQHAQPKLFPSMQHTHPKFLSTTRPAPTLKAAILDWSGTMADNLSIAPNFGMVGTFQEENVPITMEESRIPMGVSKDEHINELLALPRVATLWKQVKGKAPTDEDRKRMFDNYKKIQLDVLPEYQLVPYSNGMLPTMVPKRKTPDFTKLIPGTREAIDHLKTRLEMKIGLTTGFPRKFLIGFCRHLFFKELHWTRA